MLRFSHMNHLSITNYALYQGNTGETILNSAANHLIRFRIANVDKMVINSSGNVGIGVLNPTNKLEVNGNVDLNSTYSNRNEFIGYGTIPIGELLCGMVKLHQMDGHYVMVIMVPQI